MTSLVAGEFAFTGQDFEFIARTLYDETGIHLQKSKSTLVYSRLTKRLRALGLERFKDYCSLISRTGNDELPHMCAALTTNVTKFFREIHHFDHLRSKVLPGLLSAARAGRKVRIWSAGCSSGEEPYSVALTILSLLPEARSYDIRILATDINPHVIEVGKAGHYPEEEMGDVEPAMRNKWMERVTVKGASRYQLDDAVRGLVTFRQLNLMGNWPMRGPFQIILCRNVVIYFDDATQARIWDRIMPLLDQNGILYIGHSERISGQAVAQTHCEGTTTYRKTMKAVA
jgi:chemotaxis protein methyltransferase CheR